MMYNNCLWCWLETSFEEIAHLFSHMWGHHQWVATVWYISWGCFLRLCSWCLFFTYFGVLMVNSIDTKGECIHSFVYTSATIMMGSVSSVLNQLLNSLRLAWSSWFCSHVAELVLKKLNVILWLECGWFVYFGRGFSFGRLGSLPHGENVISSCL